MSAGTAFVIGVTSIDLVSCSADELQLVGSRFVECFGSSAGMLDPRAVERVAIPALNLTELDGPWESVCWIGPSTLTISPDEKWAVFVQDRRVRARILQEVVSLAHALGATILIGFAFGGICTRGGDMAVEGMNSADILNEMERLDFCFGEFSVPEPDLDRISSIVEDFHGDDRGGYFVVRFEPANP